MATFSAAPGTWTNVTSDANFRAWGSYVSAQLAAMGLVQTADTGQINWATVTNPGAINTYSGYEIWRFADALQATAPVYIKIQYGEGAATDGPGMRFQFGSGSDGAGNLTGILSSEWDAECGSVTSSALVRGSGGTARFCMNGGFTAAGGLGLWFGFERSKNAAGEDTAEAVLFLSHSNGSSNSTGTTTQQIGVWSTTLGDLQNSNTVMPAIFPLGSTAASGTQIMTMPILHNKGVYMNPGLNFMGYYTENITPSGTPSVYMYGAAHTYYAFPATSGISGTGWQGPGSGTEALMMRYE